MMILILSGILTKHYTAHSKTESILTHHSQKQIDHIVHSAMNNGKIPGVSVLIVKDNKVFLNKGYGYANVDQKMKVTLKQNLKLLQIRKLLLDMGFFNLLKKVN